MDYLLGSWGDVIGEGNPHGFCLLFLTEFLLIELDTQIFSNPYCDKLSPTWTSMTTIIVKFYNYKNIRMVAPRATAETKIVYSL